MKDKALVLGYGIWRLVPWTGVKDTVRWPSWLWRRIKVPMEQSAWVQVPLSSLFLSFSTIFFWAALESVCRFVFGCESAVSFLLFRWPLWRTGLQSTKPRQDTSAPPQQQLNINIEKWLDQVAVGAI